MPAAGSVAAPRRLAAAACERDKLPECEHACMTCVLATQASEACDVSAGAPARQLTEKHLQRPPTALELH